jgi:cytochrome P450
MSTTTFDATDVHLLEDPHAAYRRLREESAICRGAPGQWVVTRHAEVSALLRDRRLGTRYPETYQRISAGTGPTLSFRRRVLLNLDPPEHTVISNVMAHALRDGLSEARIGRVVDQLLDPLLLHGRMEAMADLAFPLAATVVCEIVGIPPDDRAELRERILALGPSFIPYVPEDRRATVDETVSWLRGYVGNLLTERRSRPADDLLSRMAELRKRVGTLSDEDVVDNAIFLSFAGFETTVNLVAAGCWLLAKHQDQLRLLRIDRSLVGSAVEEVLRFESPIQMTGRLVSEPMTVAGRRIRPGRTLLMLLASANRDKRVFDAPDRFDITRSPNPHVAFGGGAHYCLGGRLARTQARLVFERLMERTSRLEPLGDLVRERRPVFRGVREAWLSIRP